MLTSHACCFLECFLVALAVHRFSKCRWLAFQHLTDSSDFQCFRYCFASFCDGALVCVSIHLCHLYRWCPLIQHIHYWHRQSNSVSVTISKNERQFKIFQLLTLLFMCILTGCSINVAIVSDIAEITDSLSSLFGMTLYEWNRTKIEEHVYPRDNLNISIKYSLNYITGMNDADIFFGCNKKSSDNAGF